VLPVAAGIGIKALKPFAQFVDQLAEQWSYEVVSVVRPASPAAAGRAGVVTASSPRYAHNLGSHGFDLLKAFAEFQEMRLVG